MFQFPGFPSYTYGFSIRYCNITCSEFPHSDICGSLLICSSPQLFAACHVLLRRHVPRHPPYALCSLIFLVYLSLHTKKILISTRLIAVRPFGFTLFIRPFRINQLALLFLICLSYYAFLFYYAVVNLRGPFDRRALPERQPNHNIMFILKCQAIFQNLRKNFFLPVRSRKFAGSEPNAPTRKPNLKTCCPQQGAEQVAMPCHAL